MEGRKTQVRASRHTSAPSPPLPLCKFKGGQLSRTMLFKSSNTLTNLLLKGTLLLIEGSTVPSGETLSADICIVGAGAAGLSIAKTLNASPYTVLLVESGGFLPRADSQSLYDSEFEGLLSKSFPNYLSVSRSRYFGGSTNCWAGDVAPLDDIDFEARDWVPHSGWPLSIKDLWRYYDRACDWVEVQTFDRNPIVNQILARNPFGRFFDTRVEPKTFFHSPPTRFGIKYRSEIESSKNIRLVLNTDVTKIQLDKEAKRVERLETAVLGDSKRKFQISSKIFILATGAIENARILLLSDDVQRNGVGNENDLVGRFYMEHFRVSGHKLILAESERKTFQELVGDFRQKERKAHKIFRLKSEFQRKHKVMNSGLYFQEFHPLTEEGRGKLWNSISKLGDLPKGEPLYESKITVFGEQVPDRNNRVVLSKSKVDLHGQSLAKLIWNPVEADEEATQRLMLFFGSEVGRLGVGRVRLFKEERGFDDGMCSLGFHHMGTTRMHQSPEEGVVDSNCKVFGLDNLYISGSSVFPTSGFANPTLTIVALALRLWP
ncbi:MAG: hypothetical protein CL676_13685 [Bdellovibrionaceae bacterium]|nr:hypothetical protein [Pseudobdellovibrionaceae bacterium]